MYANRILGGIAIAAAILSSGCHCESDAPPAEKSPAAPAIVQPRYSEPVGGSGKNLAFDEESDTVAPLLTEHSRKMAQHIYRTAGNVYCAVGYGLANLTVIEGTDGLIVVDTTESTEAAAAAMADIRKITDKPVKAIIYTHNHYDHVMGTEAVASPEEIRDGRIPIYAHERLMEGLLNQLSVVGEAVLVRSLYSFGGFLDKGPDGSVNEGIGPTLVNGRTGFFPPTHTFHDRLEVTIAGVRMELIYAPSETDDEIVVWLPDQKLLQSAEVIQGETFPNLYTIRGTTYRDPVKWYRSIDVLRSLGAEYMVPSHGRPVEGAEAIESLLVSYRDAIQYTHDQAVRLINKGYTPDQLAEALPGLPEHLSQHPWVHEFYGTVKHSVRNFYNGYLGWFPGDPTVLDPAPPKKRAERYVERMGGREAVIDAAQDAFDEGEYQWCAELLSWVIRMDANDVEARNLKAEALRRLGFAQTNINWRNFYLTAAAELDRSLDLDRYDMSRGIEIMKRVPFVSLLQNIVTRIDAAKASGVHKTLVLEITDADRVYALEIRRGVVQLHDTRPAHTDLVMSGTDEVLRGILTRQRSAAKDLLLGNLKVEGGVGSLSEFFDYFDPPSERPFDLVAR